MEIVFSLVRSFPVFGVDCDSVTVFFTGTEPAFMAAALTAGAVN
ncbi:MAG: hypothetical protein ACOZCO_11850 [Bacteroidota bacterium]